MPINTLKFKLKARAVVLRLHQRSSPVVTSPIATIMAFALVLNTILFANASTAIRATGKETNSKLGKLSQVAVYPVF